MRAKTGHDLLPKIAERKRLRIVVLKYVSSGFGQFLATDDQIDFLQARYHCYRSWWSQM